MTDYFDLYVILVLDFSGKKAYNLKTGKLIEEQQMAYFVLVSVLSVSGCVKLIHISCNWKD